VEKGAHETRFPFGGRRAFFILSPSQRLVPGPCCTLHKIDAVFPFFRVSYLTTLLHPPENRYNYLLLAAAPVAGIVA
jgi:hypothetical protein